MKHNAIRKNDHGQSYNNDHGQSYNNDDGQSYNNDDVNVNDIKLNCVSDSGESETHTPEDEHVLRVLKNRVNIRLNQIDKTKLNQNDRLKFEEIEKYKGTTVRRCITYLNKALTALKTAQQAQQAQ